MLLFISFYVVSLIQKKQFYPHYQGNMMPIGVVQYFVQVSQSFLRKNLGGWVGRKNLSERIAFAERIEKTVRNIGPPLTQLDRFLSWADINLTIAEWGLF